MAWVAGQTGLWHYSRLATKSCLWTNLTHTHTQTHTHTHTHTHAHTHTQPHTQPHTHSHTHTATHTHTHTHTATHPNTYINIPPPLWSPLGMLMGYSGEEFWEARKGKNQLLMVVESCGFTLSPNGVLATFAFPVFSVSSPRGSSLGFMRTPPPP